MHALLYLPHLRTGSVTEFIFTGKQRTNTSFLVQSEKIVRGHAAGPEAYRGLCGTQTPWIRLMRATLSDKWLLLQKR